MKIHERGAAWRSGADAPFQSAIVVGTEPCALYLGASLSTWR